MTLLAPAAAAIAGGLGLAGLLLLYVLKLRRRRLRVSSTMLWEQAVDDLTANEPFRRLRTPLLFFLQLLMLAALAIAIGRPAVPSAGIEGGRVLVLIDVSASMSARDGIGGGTRLDQAKREASELIRDLPRSTAVQIATVAAQTTMLTPATAPRSAVLRAIDRIEPTDQPLRVEGVAELAAGLLAMGNDESEPDGQPAASGLVMVTDGDVPANELSISGVLPQVLRIGPEPGNRPENLGIVAASFGRDYNDPGALPLFVRVQLSAGDARDVALTTRLDGRVVDRRTVTLAASDEEPSTATATIDLRPGDASTVTIELAASDVLPTDDSAQLVIPDRAPRQVLLVSPAGGAADPSEDDPVHWVVRDVLAALPDTELTVTGPQGLTRRQADPRGLGDTDLVVLDRVGSGAEVERPTLSFAVPPSDRVGLEPPTEDAADVFVSWQQGHAAMRGLSLETVQIAGLSRLVSDTAGVLETLARGRRGPIIGLIEDGGVRRIGVAFAPAESTWPLSPSFTLFVAQAVDFLLAPRDAASLKSFTTREPLEVLVPSAVGDAPRLEGPTPLAGRLLDGLGDERLRAVFAIPQRVGLYSVVGSDVTVAVNLFDPNESGVAVRDTFRLGRREVSALSPAEGRREVWNWFVLLALGLAVIEWLWYGWRHRVA